MRFAAFPVPLLVKIEYLVKSFEDGGFEEVSAFAGTEVVEELVRRHGSAGEGPGVGRQTPDACFARQ